MQPCRTMTFEASTSRDVVLTLLHRGDFNYIAPFISSLKKSGYRGSTVLFASQVDRQTLEKVQGCGVRIEPFRFSAGASRQPRSRPWALWRWFFSSGAPRSAKMWLAHNVFHLYYLRYLLYAKFLEEHAGDFDRVLLADGRDVFFQADPFAWDWTPGVHYFLEDGDHQMGHCAVHREWFRRLFGPSYIEAHAQRTPACSGTTFGDMASMRRYIELMVNITMQALEYDQLAGGDQGVHNYILIEKLMSNITVHENGRGPVMTMKMMKKSDLQVDAQGAVLNGDGVPVPILHQYEWFPGLKAHLMNSLETAAPITVSDVIPPAVPVANVTPAWQPSRAANVPSTPQELIPAPLAPEARLLPSEELRA